MNDETATQRVLKARAELILARRFYGVLVSNVEPVLSREFPTMATDGKRHFYNPDFIHTLTQAELLGVQAHESEHDARHHGTRRGNRDPGEWNIAADYAINVDLIDEGFTLPKGALIDRRFKGMSAEDIYRTRQLEQRNQAKQGQQPKPMGGKGSDPGQCGQVLDAGKDPAKATESEVRWDRVVRQASMMAKAIGQLPAHVKRELDRANNPPRDWRNDLRDFFERGPLTVETWNRPNRRFAASGLTLPSAERDGLRKVALVIDTSGSMDETALAQIRAEVQELLDLTIIQEMTVIFGDTRVTRVDRYQTGDSLMFDVNDGGGTDLKPHFQYVAENDSDADLVLCFTDLCIGNAGPPPHCPVLFAVTGLPQDVRRRIANAPWGAHGIDVGA